MVFEGLLIAENTLRIIGASGLGSQLYKAKRKGGQESVCNANPSCIKMRQESQDGSHMKALVMTMKSWRWMGWILSHG
jgi:hypothetical protein